MIKNDFLNLSEEKTRVFFVSSFRNIFFSITACLLFMHQGPALSIEPDFMEENNLDFCTATIGNDMGDPEPIMPGRLDNYLSTLAATSEGYGPLVFPPAKKNPESIITMYVRTEKGHFASAVNSIRELGGTSTRIGTGLLAVRLPASSLPLFARLESIQRAEAALPRKLLLDESIPDIGADLVTRGRDLLHSVEGEGVILGLVDTGLDFLHPTFHDSEGLPRVLAIWNQNSSGEPPPGHSIGDYCRRESILEGTCSAVDLMGHGTHVAATAGGSDPGFTGVAPAVDFISSGSLTFELLAEASQWIFDVADEFDRPAVINMSLGGHYGAHDGTGIEEQALTEMSGPGRIIVVAAGNDGGNRIHLSYALEDEAGQTDLNIYRGFFSEGGYVDIWNEAGGSMDVQVSLLDSSREEVASTGFRGIDDPVFSGTVESDEGLVFGQAQILFEPPHPVSGKTRASVFLVPGTEPDTFAGNADGWIWVLELRGSGTFHAWISSASFGSAPASFGTEGRAGDDKSVVAMPGTAPGVITVAAYTSRNSWWDIDGNKITDDSITVGDIAFFSSKGPSTDPERTGMKPEIAAPGEFIAAPFGRNAIIFDRSTLLDTDVAVMRGTSMATPHVAGMIALMLQVKPDLDRDEALEILAATARQDEFTSDTPNDRWGYGKIDVFEAILSMIGPAADPDEDGSDSDTSNGGCGCNHDNSKQGTFMVLIIMSLFFIVRHPQKIIKL